METHFFIEKKHKAEKCQIIMYITDPVLKPRIKYFTGERILESDWNRKKERAKEKLYGDLNELLDSLERKADSIRLRLKAEGRFTREAFIEEFSGRKVEIKTFWSFWEQWIEECEIDDSEFTEKKLSDATIKRYWNTMSILQDYEKERNIKLLGTSFDRSFYLDFKKYILEERYNIQTREKGGMVNTFSGHIGILKKFLKWLSAYQEVNQKYTQYKKKFIKSEDPPFKEEDLLLFYDFNFYKYSTIKKFYQLFFPEGGKRHDVRNKLESLIRARLVLLFLCSTAKRISDYEKMEEIEIDGEVIKFISKKTGMICYVPNFDDLYFRPVYLVAEMKRLFGGLPKVSGQKLNDAIGELCKLVGFDRFKPTSKTGRITYATLKTKFGQAPKITMIATGHTTEKSFNAYVKIDQFDVVRVSKENAKYLKVS